MIKVWGDAEAEAVVALQRGIPLCERPFAEIGRGCGLSEEAVIALARRLLASGEARRFGAVFDARRMGYRSVLCAVSVPSEQIVDVAAKVTICPGVTHAYERGWPAELASDLPGGPRGRNWPNLWFTLAAPAGTFAAELETLRAACRPFAIHGLPAIRRFKIDVVFDVRTRDRDERVGPCPPIAEPTSPSVGWDERAREVVRLMQGDLPVDARLFATVAERLGLDESALLGLLCSWRDAGVLRRVGLLLRHREIGFKANGMCCWDMSEEAVMEAGRRVAAFPEVTHCYERPRMEIFPFRLYAMIHTSDWEETRQLFERISREAGLTDGHLLLSLTEFKKTSMKFF
ncbi:MAG TPA: hypothetical protein PLJ32_09130 [Kiritimatiellia bacterium]|jgi:DNA-binding Lrp family transcriptional regulator|nr:hypothetical protein [Kiritimatiellia bacterium]HOR98552.1 hypothetical protein [Kiritimatiellia bacterium]HPC49925.1 hypothetical protein [Kiritimatiellia bacterium]HPK37829.1 hypothetical protein [Kiritimatiellia bacterium]HPW76128.1 hypothetical protein [Kiritimatiellia bacterium]